MTSLNTEQKDALKHLRSFMGSNEKYFGLFGAAGTGKTTTTSKLIEQSPRTHEIALAGPTHKSVGVLAEKAPPGADCHTIHRLLGCKKHYDKTTGEVEFLPTPGKESIGEYDVVVIDECSMIGERMYGWIQEALERNPYTQVVFLGDPYQLPPVNDGEHSPTFDVPSVELTEIMRHDGPIQVACDAVREAMINSDPPPFPEPNETEIIGHNNTEEGMAEFFDRFVDGENSAKILAFKNDDVDFCNGYVRKLKYGEQAGEEPFIVGERLVIVNTYEPPTTGGIYHTGTECEVLEVDTVLREGLQCFKLYVETPGGEQFESFAFGTKTQRSAYVEKIRRLKSEAKSGGSWRRYFEVKETFAKLRPGYATTIHKSQGSTYDRVFLLQSELRGLWDKDLLARLLYVAISRASDRLIVI